MKRLLLLLFSFLFTFSFAQERVSTREANVHVLSENFKIPQLDRERRIWIYLPPSYEKKKAKHYPVLYLHDGQNLFDDKTSYIREWGVDEALNLLAKEGHRESIVVGIDNGAEKRIEELSPYSHEKYGGGKGAEYMAFIVETLKPYIDQNYRTKSSRKFTLLGGSSLGALISVYGGVKYPETFGKILSFSSAFWFNQKPLENFISSSNKSLSHQKYYFIEGTEEMEDIAKNTGSVISLLKKKGVKEKNLFYRSDPDGKHNEGYWKREFPAAYLFLMD